MSRIGKLPITIPQGVSVNHSASTISAVGPKGELSLNLSPLVELAITADTIMVSRKSNSPPVRSAHGLTRQLIANLIKGVSDGFEKRLELKGIGYRATTEGDKTLVLTVGYSHPVKIEAPADTIFKVEKNTITVSGIDKQVVGEIAAQIRRVRPPEPYKGKGIMYKGEMIRRKAGKAAKTAAA